MTTTIVNHRWNELRTTIARKFYFATILQAIVSFSIFWGLVALHTPKPPSPKLYLPVAFQFGTLFLVLGSYFLHRAVQFVRLERQTLFRRSLVFALGCAILFVGIQSYGLWEFSNGVTGFRNTQTNVHGFTLVFVSLHAMHFIVAQSILMWVTLCAFADRYDHEYFWGVVFAAWVWHVLGIVWAVLLAVFGISIPV
ncbi:MAG: hypothetical protein JNL58_24870 [Planctomyces sp.]|nr:hypothetical protein [Planctomyces sp.]